MALKGGDKRKLEFFSLYKEAVGARKGSVGICFIKMSSGTPRKEFVFAVYAPYPI